MRATRAMGMSTMLVGYTRVPTRLLRCTPHAPAHRTPHQKRIPSTAAHHDANDGFFLADKVEAGRRNADHLGIPTHARFSTRKRGRCSCAQVPPRRAHAVNASPARPPRARSASAPARPARTSSRKRHGAPSSRRRRAHHGGVTLAFGLQGLLGLRENRVRRSTPTRAAQRCESLRHALAWPIPS